MVFQDISNSFELGSFVQKNRAANLTDRFFAFLIDISVILPFVFFLLYLTFSEGFNFWRSEPSAPESAMFTFIILFCFMFYFSLIQSLFVVYFNATPGQYFLKIRLQFQESSDFIFLRVFFRQFSFWCSFAFLGLPLMGMLTNKARQTFYDRMGAILVVTKKSVEDSLAFENEYRYWQSFMATLVVFSGLLIGILVWRHYHQIIQRTASFIALDEKNYFCKDLKEVELTERLPLAVALNLVNQLSDECLEKEANFVLWKQKVADESLAYYAKSLVAVESENERDYLEQSCKGQDIERSTINYANLTLGCQLSYSFLNNKFDELYLVLRASSELTFLNNVLKYELSQMLHKTDDIKSNFSVIKQYSLLHTPGYPAARLIKKYQLLEMISQKNLGFSARTPASDDVNKDTSEDEMIKLIEGL